MKQGKDIGGGRPGESGGDDLAQAATRLHKAIRQRLKEIKAQERAAHDIEEGARKQDATCLLRGVAALDPNLLERHGLGGPSRALLDQARPIAAELRAERARELGRKLQAACEREGRAFGRLGESPPEYRVAPFTVRLDPQTMEAVLCYSREELCRVAAEARPVLEAAREQQRALEKKPPEPERLFDLLLGAYRAALAERGARPGERVELLELLPRLALALQPRRFLERPRRELFVSYDKARFLFDLARLRRARLLSRHGWRLDLGTATGDSTRNKARVFFLEEPGPGGGGQYYLSARFVEEPRTPGSGGAR